MFKVGFAAPYNRAQDSLNCPSENPVMLFLKDSLLKSVKRKSILNLTKEIELSNDINYTDKPLQGISDSNDATSNNDVDSLELEMEIADVKTKNTDLKVENTILQERIKELKSSMKIIQIIKVLICKGRLPDRKLILK